ncbi:hypothetical protein DYB28_011117, partial [Aphanomyces astaci]
TTGVEDGLQDLVLDFIEKLRLTRIKIWGVMDNHIDTAVKVARSANLLCWCRDMLQQPNVALCNEGPVVDACKVVLACHVSPLVMALLK